MSSFSTGLSALSTSQRALDVIAQNIANASTPGYHRQVARLATRLPSEVAGLSIGTGVKITDVRRLRNSLLEAAVTQHGSELSNTTAQLTAMRHLEALLTGGEGSVHDRLEAFFNQLDQLSARPDDSTARRVVLGTATALTNQLNTLAGDISRFRDGVDAEIANVVAEVGPITRHIAELNAAIQRAELRGVGANDLRDQRDQLVNELAERVGGQVLEQDEGQTTVLLSGVPLVIGNSAVALETTIDDQGQVSVTLAGSDQTLAVTEGTLGGLLRVRNQSLTQIDDRLNAIAHEFMRSVDHIHATGLGLSGPMTILTGQRAASSVTASLADANLAFPPQAGSLFISVTDLATGARSLHEIAIDPATQSLTDVAAAISAVGNIQAIADAQTNTLRVIAAPGYAFDFAGRLETSPGTAGITGTTMPTIGGSYSGANNDTFTFRVVGSGTIGVTPNLTLEVRNAAGSVIGSLNVGQGYEPGSALNVADGVTVALGAGDANDGDTFSSRIVADADTAGILAALGLNSFFTGQDANDIRVREDVVATPALMAGSRSGQPGDGANVRRMANVRDLTLLEGGTETLTESFAGIIGDVATRVQELDQLQTNQQTFGDRLNAERQSVSGVDPNEELVKMVEFQRAFQLASRYINAVNETLDDLFRII